MRRSLLYSVLALAACATPAAAKDEMSAEVTRMVEAVRGGKPDLAVSEADKVIAFYRGQFHDPATRYLCRGEDGSGNLMSLLEGALDKQDTMLVSGDWCLAHFVKGFALIDLHRADLAEPDLKLATEMAPRDAHYANEYAELFKSRREWQKSHDLFAHAYEIADKDPKGQRPQIAARALRGMGFNKIELGDLDEAERLFKRSQELEPDSPAARSELQFIAQQRSRGRGI